MMVMRDARTPIERGAHCGLAIGQAQQWQAGDQRSDAQPAERLELPSPEANGHQRNGLSQA
jgi:hypothetical protein